MKKFILWFSIIIAVPVFAILMGSIIYDQQFIGIEPVSVEQIDGPISKAFMGLTITFGTAATSFVCGMITSVVLCLLWMVVDFFCFWWVSTFGSKTSPAKPK